MDVMLRSLYVVTGANPCLILFFSVQAGSGNGTPAHRFCNVEGLSCVGDPDCATILEQGVVNGPAYLRKHAGNRLVAALAKCYEQAERDAPVTERARACSYY